MTACEPALLILGAAVEQEIEPAERADCVENPEWRSPAPPAQAGAERLPAWAEKRRACRERDLVLRSYSYGGGGERKASRN